MVYLFLTDNTQMIEALTPVDMLRRANIEVCTVSITESLTVTSSNGVKINADKMFEQCDFNDITAAILPGGPGVPSMIAHKPLCDLILKNYKKGNLTAAICAAPTLLSAIGLKEKTAVFPGMKDKVFSYSEQRVCIDSNVITAAAMGCSEEFSYEIIKYLMDENAANAVSDSILMRK